MKRSEGLTVVTRRHFCAGFATCVGIALIDCTDGNAPVVQTGGLNGSDGESTGSGSGSGMGMQDAGVSVHDASGTSHDAGTAATCPSTGVTDVGAPSTFVTNMPVYFSSGNFFVVRDSGGLYALTARCTHEGVTITAETSDFFCPAHGATFDFDGNVTGGPAFTNLVHYAMCTLANGHVGVITSQTVAQSQRLVA